MSAGSYSDLALCRRLLLQSRPYWRSLAGVFLLHLLSTLLALLAPVPLKLVVDHVLNGQPVPSYLLSWFPAAQSRTAVLVFSVVLLIALAVVTQGLGIAGTLLTTSTGKRLVLEFRAALFRHVQRLSLIYHDSQGTYDSTYRIQYDAPSIEWITISGMLPFATSLVKVIAMIYVTLRIDWQLALVGLAISPPLWLLARGYRDVARVQWREVKKHESSAASVVQEALSAVRVVKAFGQEELEEQRYLRHSTASIGAYLRAVFVDSGYGMLVALITATGTAAVLYVGAQHVQSGALTLGTLLLVMAYLGQLYEPLKTIGNKTATMQAHLASAERVFSVLDEAPEVIEKPDARRLIRASGNVVFQGVSFGYESDHCILRDVSFEAMAGTRIGILGKTGAGKTTLVNLLNRFYDPTSGRILLDGADLRDYRLADLRNQFGIVSQEPVLFSTSIAENIAYARPGAPMEDIIGAATLADAHEFISSLPAGYDTLVGERGMKLSGGERQRVALARAFLKNAPMLVLDEPTSSVDVETEAQIVAAMDRLMGGRTAFIIAHRLSTLEGCDVFLVLRDRRLTVHPARVSVDVLRQVAFGEVGEPAQM
jgi:ATP-binding cassette subfamily B protein